MSSTTPAETALHDLDATWTTTPEALRSQVVCTASDGQRRYAGQQIAWTVTPNDDGFDIEIAVTWCSPPLHLFRQRRSPAHVVALIARQAMPLAPGVKALLASAGAELAPRNDLSQDETDSIARKHASTPEIVTQTAAWLGVYLTGSQGGRSAANPIPAMNSELARLAKPRRRRTGAPPPRAGVRMPDSHSPLAVDNAYGESIRKLRQAGMASNEIAAELDLPEHDVLAVLRGRIAGETSEGVPIMPLQASGSSYGERLQAAMTVRSVAQIHLAKSCGVSQGTISNALAGRHTLARSIARIAFVLRVPANWLRVGIGNAPPAVLEELERMRANRAPGAKPPAR